MSASLTPTAMRGDPAASERLNGMRIAFSSPCKLASELLIVICLDWKSICQMAVCNRLAPISPARERQASVSGGSTQSTTAPTS